VANFFGGLAATNPGNPNDYPVGANPQIAMKLQLKSHQNY
jgi:hypothetical protein